MTVNPNPATSSQKVEPKEVRIEAVFAELERPDKVVNQLSQEWKHGPK